MTAFFYRGDGKNYAILRQRQLKMTITPSPRYDDSDTSDDIVCALDVTHFITSETAQQISDLSLHVSGPSPRRWRAYHTTTAKWYDDSADYRDSYRGGNIFVGMRTGLNYGTGWDGEIYGDGKNSYGWGGMDRWRLFILPCYILLWEWG